MERILGMFRTLRCQKYPLPFTGYFVFAYTLLFLLCSLIPHGFSALPPWCECGTAEKRQGRIKALHERGYVELWGICQRLASRLSNTI